MSSAAVVGFVAGAVTVVSFIPQVLRAWRTRRTRDLSLGAFSLLGLGAGLWLTYGLLLGDGPMIVTNAAVLAMVSSIVVAKLRFDGRPEDRQATSPAAAAGDAASAADQPPTSRPGASA